MKIEFKRTGGLSPLTNTSGVIEFKGDGGEVSSAIGGYRRSLTQEESNALRDAANPQNFGGSAAASSANPVRDGFNYQMTVTTEDGKKHSFTSTQGDKLPASAAQLIKWIQGESQKITAHRAGGG